MKLRTTLLCIYLMGLIAPQASRAETDRLTVSTREELVRALRAAEAGTTILIAPGTYAGGLSRQELRGTAEKPVIITAADPQQPPVIAGGANAFHFSKVEHLQLSHLIIDGATANGLNLDDGGDLRRPSRFVTLKHLQIRNIGPNGNRDGIKLSGVSQFSVEHSLFNRWGNGGGSGIDMVGCHQGVIQDCYFTNPNAPNSNGVQAKGGSSEIRVLRCFFTACGGRAVQLGGSTGLSYFRPEPAGFEAKNLTVEDCTFVNTMASVAFVGVDGALVQHNTIVYPQRWAIRILQETQLADFVPCRQGRFLKNVVLFRGEDISTLLNIGDKTAPETFTFSGNLWYCEDRPDRTARFVQLPVAESEPVPLPSQGVQFVKPTEHDYRLKLPSGIDAGTRVPYTGPTLEK